MNIKPEQIPDEVVEAAARELARRHEFDPDETWQEFDRNAHHSYAAIGETYEDPTVVRWHLYKDSARAALAAALPVLLGEPVAWGVQFVWEGMGKSEIRMLALYRDEAEGVAYLEQQKISPGIPVSVNAIPLYTPPTPEIPNDHP
ncbi:hypothetical protein [Pseudoxanthomonas sp.]|uniref:hypothetical protein n=1 Tax=Pseudoxanthomonas sp. TaxID=1871049 RepID=UPI003F810BA0